MEFRGGLAGGVGPGGAGRRRRRGRRAGLRLGMERLEERVVLSTWTWTGAGSTSTTPGNWSDATNWQGTGGGTGVPVAGDSLVFPTGLTGAALTSNDDLTTSSFGGALGSLTIQDAGYSIASSQSLGMSLTGSIDASQSSGSSTLDLPVAFGSTAGVVKVDTAGATLVMGGAITGSAGLTKQGGGTLDLTGTSTYTGGTTVAAGTLLVGGSTGAITIDSGTTLGGAGTVASIGSTSGTVSPGDPATSTGILTDSGPLTMDSGSSFDVTLGGTAAGTNYEQLAVGGAVTLGGARLNVSLGSFVPTAGESFTIVHNTGGAAVSGTFAGLANGATLTVGTSDFVINYAGGSSGHDVVLTAVTPPTVTWSGAAASGSTPNDNWSDGANWVGGAAPVSGDTLIFPSGLTGAALTSNDDISGGTFGSVLIQGSGYTIASSQGYGVSLSGSVDASYGSGSSTWSLPVAFTGSSGTVTVDNTAAGLTMGGVISGSVGLTKQGSGVLDVTATNTYTGATTVAAGALLVDGTVGGVAVSSGATVGGAGTVGSIATTSGTVSPGDSSTVTAILTDTGALTLDSGSSFDATINGTTVKTQYDQLVVAGAVNLAGATLNVSTGSFNPTPGSSFTILHNTSGQAITNTFNGLAEGGTVIGSGHTFSITYKGGSDGQDVVLTAITPPTVTWSGTDAVSDPTKDNWSDTTNWVGRVAPVSGDTVVFPANLTGNALTSNNDIPGLTLFNLNIQASGYVIKGDPVGVAGSIDASQSSSDSTVSMPITFNSGAGTVTVDNSGATLLLTGAVAGPTGVTKQGTGTLSLEANNGTLESVVDAGTVLVDGSTGNVTANSGTTLGGTGTVGQLTTVGATVQPGDSSTSTGILTANGGVTLDPNSTFAETLNGTTAGTGYDQLVAGGTGSTINLDNAKLTVTPGSSFSFSGGQQFTILHNTTGSPITGTFSGLAEGATVTPSGSSDQFAITYKGGTDSQDVVLTALYPTTTSLSVSPSSGAVSGQSTTLTATVAHTSGNAAPTGTVSFSTSISGSSVSLGTATLNSSGVATLTTTMLTAGTNSITATYSGDTTYGTSTSSAQAVVVSPASTTTTLTVSPTSTSFGQLVTLTATIAAVAPGSGTPTGTVQFLNGTANVGSAVTLSGGTAVLTTATLPVGTDSITAVYSPPSSGANFTTSTSSAQTVVISAATTSVTLSISNPNPFALQSVTLTAIVSSPTSSSTVTPTGTVTFETSTGIIIGTGTLSSGSATLTTSNIPIGQQSLIAVYPGDSNFGGASSLPLSVVIGHSTDLYINQIYLDIFGIPGGNVSTYWVALLNAGYTRPQVVSEILKSRAAKAAEVNHVYEQTLKRPATSAESRRALRSGLTSTTPLYARLFGSAEFYQTQGHGTTDGFLTALALDWFGAPFPASLQSRLASQLARGTSRSEVARQVITSPGGVNAQVNTIVEGVLGRPATAQEQRRFAPLVRQGNLIAVYQTLFTSSAFITKYVALT